MKKIGCGSIMSCTIKYYDKWDKLLQNVPEVSGINIIANTGIYGVDNSYVPKHAFESNAEKIAQTWLDELNNGIDNIGINPGL
jgi:phosphotriesterase-related protein